MKKVLAFAALLAPLAARAEVGLRVGGGIDAAFGAGSRSIFGHGPGTTPIGFTDFAPAEAEAMLSWWLPHSTLSVDLALAEEAYFNAPPGAPVRSGTTLRPGIRLVPVPIPVYARLAVPIHLETAAEYAKSRGPFALRFGLGLSPRLAEEGGPYLEADFDQAVGSSNDARVTWHLLLNFGLDFRL
jgi:hypothetical protein